MSRREHAEANLEGSTPGNRLVEQATARRAVQTALKDGSLQRQPCEVCGTDGRVHAHHDDYSKPLDVRWLCGAHHVQHHLEERSPRGLTLREVRERRGLSLRDVEAETGINRGILSSIERGKAVATPVQMLALSDTYGVLPDGWQLFVEYRIAEELAA